MHQEGLLEHRWLVTGTSDSVSLGWGLRISIKFQMMLMFLAQEPNFEKHWGRQQSGDQYGRSLIKGSVRKELADSWNYNSASHISKNKELKPTRIWGTYLLYRKIPHVCIYCLLKGVEHNPRPEVACPSEGHLASLADGWCLGIWILGGFLPPQLIRVALCAYTV